MRNQLKLLDLPAEEQAEPTLPRSQNGTPIELVTARDEDGTAGQATLSRGISGLSFQPPRSSCEQGSGPQARPCSRRAEAVRVRQGADDTPAAHRGQSAAGTVRGQCLYALGYGRAPAAGPE